MTQVSQIVDGYGQTGTRVYASLSDAPSPRVGAFIVVDNGTSGTLYVGIHVAGTPTWVSWTSLLSGAIVQAPTTGQNVISDANAGEFALAATGDRGVQAISRQLNALAAEQIDATPLDPVVDIVRFHAAPSVPLADASADGTNFNNWLNGYAELVLAHYSALPTANANHVGAIVRLIAGGGGTDSFWTCALVAGTPTWLQVQFSATLSGFILTNPNPNSVNTITGHSGDTGPVLTAITADGKALVLSGLGNVETVTQRNDLGGSGAIERWIRNTPDPASNVLEVDTDGLTHIPVLDGHAAIVVRTYSALPSPSDGSRLNELAATVDTHGALTGLFIGVKDDAGVFGWDQIIPIPLPSAIAPYPPFESNATWDFWFDCDAVGTHLPYEFPSGSLIKVLGGQGFWECSNVVGDVYLTDWLGTSADLEHSINIGRAIGQEQLRDTNDKMTFNGTETDVTVGLVTDTDSSFVVLSANRSETGAFAGTGLGDMSLHVQITTPAPGTEYLYFFLAEYGFASYSTDCFIDTDWVYGLGWAQSNDSVHGLHCCKIYRRVDNTSHIDHLLLHIFNNTTSAGGDITLRLGPAPNSGAYGGQTFSNPGTGDHVIDWHMNHDVDNTMYITFIWDFNPGDPPHRFGYSECDLLWTGSSPPFS